MLMITAVYEDFFSTFHQMVQTRSGSSINVLHTK